jgi:type VI secretion system protein ImpM
LSTTAVSSVGLSGEAGFFGKLPIRGDFITRNLPRSFIDPWDDWLQQAIARSHQQLQQRWLDCYLTSPVWRFALSAGACGPDVFAGTLMPSMDRVGRYYPLVIAAPLARSAQPLALLERGQDWFQAAEQSALKALEEEWELEEFATHVSQLSALQGPVEIKMSATAATGRQQAAWYCPLLDGDDAAEGWSTLTEYLLQQCFPRYSLWWSQGSEHIAPCLLICQGLPPIEGFAALLAGNWAQSGWTERALYGQKQTFFPSARENYGSGS